MSDRKTFILAAIQYWISPFTVWLVYPLGRVLLAESLPTIWSIVSMAVPAVFLMSPSIVALYRYRNGEPLGVKQELLFALGFYVVVVSVLWLLSVIFPSVMLLR